MSPRGVDAYKEDCEVKWTAALRAVKQKLATARPEQKAKRMQPNPTLRANTGAYRGRMLLAGAMSAIIFVGGAFGMLRHIHRSDAMLQVYQNGHYIGLVPNDHDIYTRMQRVAAGYNIALQAFPIHTDVSTTYPWQKVASLPTAAAAIEVNHRPLLYTTSVHDANRVLQRVKQSLTANVQQGQQKTVSFVEHVGIRAETVGVKNILEPDDAVDLLLHPAKQNQIAGRATSPSAQLLQQNTIQAKSAQKPLLSVRSQVTVTETKSCPYHVKYVNDASLAKGSEKVVAKGKMGTKKETVRQTYINGQQTAADVLSSVTLAKPVDEIVERGTNPGIEDGDWIWPTDIHTITSPFGWRFGGAEFHPGMDIGVPTGTPIHATNNGTVISAGWNSGGYGNWVEIDNGNGITTVFGHMSHVEVHSGELVSKGQLIGESGSTGDATGPHLHYEVRLNGTPVQPMNYV